MFRTNLIVLMLAAATCLNISPAGADAEVEHFPADWFWGKEKQREKQDALVGQAMPTYELGEWLNKELTADDLKGKIVVIDLWATWCGPCLRALPHTNEMSEKYADQGVVVMAICGSRGQEKMEAIAKQKQLTLPMAKDVKGEAAKAYNLMWWPTMVVIDRNQKIRGVGLKPGKVEAAIEMLLKEQPADGKPAEQGDEAKAETGAAQIKDAWLEGSPQQRERLAGMTDAAPPAMSVTDWTNTDELKLESLKGKVVLVDFWATWCGPCLRSIPHTNELMAKYGEDGLVIIGVCHSRGSDKMKSTVEAKGIKYPVVADVQGKTVKAWKVNGFPDYYLIDRAGKLRIPDCKNGSVEQAIKALLAEPAPTAE